MKKLSLTIPGARAIGRWAVAIAAVTFMSALRAAEAPAAAQPTKKTLTVAEVLAASTPADWRQIDPQNTIYMDLPSGRVIIELAPQFAPHYVANVEALARGGYFNGLWIERVQDNYVVQWGDPDGKKSVGNAQRTVAAEFERT
jgi:peptidylprolyl isomerase